MDTHTHAHTHLRLSHSDSRPILCAGQQLRDRHPRAVEPPLPPELNGLRAPAATAAFLSAREQRTGNHGLGREEVDQRVAVIPAHEQRRLLVAVAGRPVGRYQHPAAHAVGVGLEGGAIILPAHLSGPRRKSGTFISRGLQEREAPGESPGPPTLSPSMCTPRRAISTGESDGCSSAPPRPVISLQSQPVC